MMPWENPPAKHKFGGWHKFQWSNFKNIEWTPPIQVYTANKGPLA